MVMSLLAKNVPAPGDLTGTKLLEFGKVIVAFGSGEAGGVGKGSEEDANRSAMGVRTSGVLEGEMDGSGEVR